ncbi:DUF6193 family natural product biosynthesis protein [Streptomyces laurentii]|uniref:DUF6193 family natural product biosynthesis protein n=1 Tax=Streptomyces laurentii TaxID=39478 RepID=UPI00369EC956
MTEQPDPALLYPDIAAHGGLGAALLAVAEAEGISLPASSVASDSLVFAAVESVVPRRRPLRVSARSFRRVWSVGGSESLQGLSLVDGETVDLTEVVRVARAWHDGVELDGIHEAAPFMELSGRFEVPDGDPVLLAESEWRFLCAEAAAERNSRRQELFEAAYAEPVLRNLYPFTSHGVLRFSTATRPRLVLVGPCLSATEGAPYTVREEYMGARVLAETATAAEAVAAASRHMPPDLGPVTLGV